MTCQCTCGKHMLVDISKSVIVPVNVAGAVPSGFGITTYADTAACGAPPTRQFVEVVPNTACAAPRMPNCSVRVEP